MLLGPHPHIVSLAGVGAQILFAVIGELFVAYSSIINALPLWILGVPLAVTVFSCLRRPQHSDLVPVTGYVTARSGTTAISKG
jgi:hypothetical protein